MLQLHGAQQHQQLAGLQLRKVGRGAAEARRQPEQLTPGRIRGFDMVLLDGDRITNLSFDGSGCAISQASASLMTTQLKGKTAAETQKLYDEFHHIVTTGEAPDDAEP